MSNNKSFFGSDIGKAISSGYFLFFLNNVVALFLTPYILKFVTKQEYGLYVLCSDFLSWMIFLEFGSSKVMEAKGAHLLAADDKPGLIRAFNSSLFFQFFMAILIIPIFYFLVITGLKNYDIPHLRLIIIVFSITAGLSVIRSIFSAILIASRKIHIDNKIQVLINVLNYALILLLIPYIGIEGLAAISLLVAALILLRSYKRVFHLFPYLHIDFKNFNKAELKSILSQGIYFSIASIATMLITKFDSFFLGKSFGLATVAKFYISIKLISVAEKLFMNLVNNIRPYIANFYGIKKIDLIHNFYNLALPLLLSLSLIIFSGILFINERFIHIWVGTDFFIGNKFVVLFGIYTIINIVTLPARIVLTSTFYQLKTATILRISEGALRLTIILLFMKSAATFLLPLSSIISAFLLGFLGQHLVLHSFFKSYSIPLENKYPYFLTLLLLTVCIDEMLSGLQYTPLILLFFGLLLSVHFYLYNRKNMFSFIQLLKVAN